MEARLEMKHTDSGVFCYIPGPAAPIVPDVPFTPATVTIEPLANALLTTCAENGSENYYETWIGNAKLSAQLTCVLVSDTYSPPLRSEQTP